MIEFTEAERAYHREMRSLTTDAGGREILVGLTLEETEFYVSYSRRRSSGDRDRDPVNKSRFLELHEKHEWVRLQIIGAEVQARGEPRQ